MSLTMNMDRSRPGFWHQIQLGHGGPAPESVTNKIFETSKTLTSYKVADIPDVDITTIGTKTYGGLEVEIVDSTATICRCSRKSLTSP